MNIVIYFLWVLFLACTPLYLLPSGGPQLAHIPLLLIFLYFIFRHRASIFRNSPVKAFSVFVLYATSVNLCFCFFSDFRELGFLLSSLYLIFNVMTLAVSYAIISSEKGLSLLYYALTFIAFAQICAFPVLGMNYGGVRYMAFFNDPNQLASWSLFASVIFAAMKQREKISVVKFLVGGGACATLVLLSVSRGGVIALACIWCIVFWKSSLRVKLLLGLACVISLCVLFPYIEEMPFFSRVQSLSETDIGQDRHWNRIWEFPLYNILGAGEGDNFRFDLTGLEIHSTLLTVLFCYGLPGILLYLRFIKTCIFKTFSNQLVLLFLPLLPSFISVNMIRMTSLYVMFGCLSALLIRRETRITRERGVADTPPPSLKMR